MPDRAVPDLIISFSFPTLNQLSNLRKALKGLRWLLFKHSSRRSKKDTRILNALRKGNRRIHRAWILKDEFEQFWARPLGLPRGLSSVG